MGPRRSSPERERAPRASRGRRSTSGRAPPRVLDTPPRTSTRAVRSRRRGWTSRHRRRADAFAVRTAARSEPAPRCRTGARGRVVLPGANRARRSGSRRRRHPDRTPARSNARADSLGTSSRTAPVRGARRLARPRPGSRRPRGPERGSAGLSLPEHATRVRAAPPSRARMSERNLGAASYLECSPGLSSARTAVSECQPDHATREAPRPG